MKDKNEFQYKIDKNIRRRLGVFYTPDLYSKKTLELVRMAISNIPKENDYIILDRCAGIGNLEKYMTDDELSHCVLSTYNFEEYQVLKEKFNGKVRHIIFDKKEKITDALSEKYINNKTIKKYVVSKNCNVILLENPPYAETTGIEHQKLGQASSNSSWKKSFVVSEMKKEIKNNSSTEMANAFIWSGFNYYLKKENDTYIVLAPIKYWKTHKIIENDFVKGFAFNSKYFGTKHPSCITCIYWKNTKKDKKEKLEIECFDIKEDQLVNTGKIEIKQINTKISDYYDKRVFKDDVLKGIFCELDGTENKKTNIIGTGRYNKNIIGYIVVKSTFNNPELNTSLLVTTRYDGVGSYLREDNFMEILPIFSAGRYLQYKNLWYERAMLMKTADMKEKYLEDVKSGKLNIFLLKNLFFVCLNSQNHCRSLIGSDGRIYKNQLCLDKNTLASKKLEIMCFNDLEKEIYDIWIKILEITKKNEKYNKKFNYGVYQIEKEINTKENVELNTLLKELKIKLKEYYLKEIMPVLIEYEFIK